MYDHRIRVENESMSGRESVLIAVTYDIGCVLNMEQTHIDHVPPFTSEKSDEPMSVIAPTRRRCNLLNCELTVDQSRYTISEIPIIERRYYFKQVSKTNIR